jgi:uncharacterized protein YjbJ (UPF0337 family)
MDKLESRRSGWEKYGSSVIHNIKADLDKSSAIDQAEGTIHEVRGRFIKAAGKLYGDQDLESKGAAEIIVGKIQIKAGQIKKVFGK